MQFCPFISTADKKLEPSPINCHDCYFYVYEAQTAATYCAIRLAAERSSATASILSKDTGGR